MNKFKIKINLEKGQVLPLVVLMMFVIIGMVALIVDGGAIMSNRRTAQAAADAGALAGAQRACSGYSDAEAVAEQYAMDYNDATTADATVNGQVVTVEATVENPSFFARIFGAETLSASADATASCFGPDGHSVVPVGFYCREFTLDEDDETFDCVQYTLDWDIELSPLLDDDLTNDVVTIDEIEYKLKGTSIVTNDSAEAPLMKYIYIIKADGTKVCKSDGGDYECDLSTPKDGKDELQFGGNRSWLYLTNPAQTLKNYIDKGVDSGINISGHQWLSGDPGEINTLYKDMINADFVGKVVLVPVYNYLCEGDPRDDSDCVDAAHAGKWPDPPLGGDNMDSISGKKNNYHILTFAPFYVSCIARNESDEICPGYDIAASLPDSDLETNSVSIIEGYFISGYTVSLDDTPGCGINTGNCTVSLFD